MISRIPLRLSKAIKRLNIQMVCAPFCSQLQKVDKVGQKLIKIVEKELKYEKTNYVQDETATDFVEKAGFQMIDNENDYEVQLEKQVGDVKVIVCFQSRQPNTEDEPQEEQEQQQQQQQQEQDQEQEEEQNEQDFAEFTVYLQKSNGQILCYECTTQQGEIQISQVTMVKDLELHKKIPRFERGLSNYGGPDFVTLDERLQMALVEYLRGYGINDELGAFIEHYSLDKEERLYIQWLDQLTTFLKN